MKGCVTSFLKMPPNSADVKNSRQFKSKTDTSFLSPYLSEKDESRLTLIMESIKLATCGNTVTVWDFPEMKKIYQTGGRVVSAAWNNDGSCLASCSSNKRDHINLINVEKNFCTSLEILGPRGPNSTIKGMCFPKSSQKSICIAADDHVMVFDLSRKRVRQDFPKIPNVSCLTTSGNDKYIAAGTNTGHLHIVNPMTGRAAFTQPIALTKDQSGLTCTKFNNIKQSMIGASCDSGSAIFWDIHANKEVYKFNEHKAPATGLAFSPVNEVLVMSSGLDKRCVCYDTLTKKPASTIWASQPLTSVDFALDGTNLALGTSKGLVYMYDLRSFNAPFAVIDTQSSSPLTSVLFQPGNMDRSNISSVLSSMSRSYNHSSNSVTTSHMKENLKPDINDSFGSHGFSPLRTDGSLVGSPAPFNESIRGFLSAGSRLSSESAFSPLRETSFNNASPLAPNQLRLSTTPLLSSIREEESLQAAKTEVTKNESIEESSVEKSLHLPEVTSPVARSSPEIVAQDTSNHVKAILTAFPNALEGETSEETGAKTQVRSQVVSSTSTNVERFQQEYVQAAVEEAMDEFCSDMRKQMWHWHYDMIKAFQQQNQEIRAMLRECNVNEALLEEVQRLRLENASLKQTPFVANFTEKENSDASK